MRPRGIIILGVLGFALLGLLILAADRFEQFARDTQACAKLEQSIYVEFALTLQRGFEVRTTCVGKNPSKPT
jgi:hypothetical protein